MQSKAPPGDKITVNSSERPDTSGIATPLSSAIASSPSDSRSSTSSSQESDEMLITKPQPPPALCPTRLPNPGKYLPPILPQFLLVTGEMSADEGKLSADEGNFVMPDVKSSVPSVSSGTNSDKDVQQSAECTCADISVGSDVSSEPLTFHTDFGDDCNTAAFSDEEHKALEDLLSKSSKSKSKLLDVNENIDKKKSSSNDCGVHDSDVVSDHQKLDGLPDPLKTVAGLCDTSQFMPVTTSTVVVNMVLSSVATQPEGQSSTALEPPEAASHSQEHDNMSISDAASTHDAPDTAAADKDKDLQPPEKSFITEQPGVENTADADESDDANREQQAVLPSSDGETRTMQIKPKSPSLEKSKSRSKTGKRSRSRSSERKRHRSWSSEHRNGHSRSSKRSDSNSPTRSPGNSSQRDSKKHKNHKRSQSKDRKRSWSKDHKRSRSSSHSQRRRSTSRERHSHSRSSHGSRRRERSRSRSYDSRRKRSRSQSCDTKRRSRSTDIAQRKRESRSRSQDRSRQHTAKGRRISRDDSTARRDDSSVQSVIYVSSSSSKCHQSDHSHDSPHHQRRSPSQSERVAKKRSKRAACEKSGDPDIEKTAAGRQSDFDLSGAESGRRQRTREEDEAENNRIAVISSSSATNRRARQKEFESDEDPPADFPAAYDPSEPTEDNFRDDRNVSDHCPPLPTPHWVPVRTQRMPMVEMLRPPPPVYPSRLPPPPLPSPRFQHRPPPPPDAVPLDMKSVVVPPNQFVVGLSDAGRPPLAPPPMVNVLPPLPRPTEVQPPPVTYTRPMLTAPAGVIPQPPTGPPVRLPAGVDTVPLIVRGPMEPARLIFVPPGVGQPVVGLPRIVCPPAQGPMPELVRLPIGQPQPPPGSVLPGPIGQPPPGSVLSGPPFVSGNQIMIQRAPVVFQQQVPPEHRVESPQPPPPPQIIPNIPISQIPRSSQPFVSNVGEMPFPLGGGNSGQPTLPNMSVPLLRPSQPQPAPMLSSSSASSPSSGSQDAEDLLMERYRAKPEPPQSLFPSQKSPDPPPKPIVDTHQWSPDQLSQDSDKSSDHMQPPQPPSLPMPDLRTVVTTASEVVPTSTSETLPSDPRLLVQFLMNQSRQSATVSDKHNSPTADKSTLVKPSPPADLHLSKVENNQGITDNSPEKVNKGKLAYSPSQADYLSDEEDHQGPSESVRDMKVCLFVIFPT